MINLLAGHLLGDIIFQNRWLASFKVKNIWGIFLHCFLYSLSICLFTSWIVRLPLVFATHFFIDYLSVGKTMIPNFIKMGNPKNNNEPCPMWLRLLCDQSLHIITLAIISKI